MDARSAESPHHMMSEPSWEEKVRLALDGRLASQTMDPREGGQDTVTKRGESERRP